MSIFVTIDFLRRKFFLQIFTIYVRYLIGGAFIIAAFGMGKVTSARVNLMSALDKPIEELEPIQQFFRVMMDSGLYWQFIGWTQIVAGVLLMTQRFARVGALIFFPLILNIFVITIAYGFKGTPVVTGLMLLAVTYLLVWDLPYLQQLFRNKATFVPTPLQEYEHTIWRWLGVVMVVTIVASALYQPNLILELGLPFLEGLTGFIIFLFIRKRSIAKVTV